MIYAVGDIHGYVDPLDRALELIAADGGPDAPIVFLGDYVDRGPDVPGVLDRLSRGMAEGRPWTCLLGNHDRLFRRFLDDGAVTDGVLRPGLTWLSPPMGGYETLAAYVGRGAMPPADAGSEALDDLRSAVIAAVPEAHRRLLAALVPSHETDDQIFVHAGLRPGRPLEDQIEDDLVWIREPFLSDPRDHGRLVVHGHTALPAARHHGNRLNLDSGAGFGHPITAAAIDGRAAWVLTRGGRVPLTP
ncbi:MAG: metallophosphoesterase family protein [Pseudomonadota bacterium]